MQKHLQLSTILLALGVFLFAQEKTEVTVKVTEDGKVVKDTTYTFDDAADAKHAIHMMDAMASDDFDLYFSDADEHIMHMKKDGDHKMHANKAMFISEDGNGKKKIIKKEIIIISDGEEGEHSEWTIHEHNKGENVEVIVIKTGKDCDEDIEVEIKKEKKQKKYSTTKAKEDKTKK